MDYNVTNEDAKLFVEQLSERCGCDYTLLSMAIIKSRIRQLLNKYKIETIKDLSMQFSWNKTLAAKLIFDFSDTYRELFRDPIFLRQFRKKVNPMVRILSNVKIWVPECGNGMEAYTLALTLKDTDVFDRVEILATDSNLKLLEVAEKGSYKADKISKYIQNYHDSGGKTDINQFIKIGSRDFEIREDIRKQIKFQYRGILEQTDDVFHLIFCRNAMIYYDRPHQHSILDVFYDHLYLRGFLCLGEKENFLQYDGSDNYRNIAGKEKVFQKVK